MDSAPIFDYWTCHSKTVKLQFSPIHEKQPQTKRYTIVCGPCTHIVYLWPYSVFVQYISIIRCWICFHPSRRHVFYLWHHWRREHQHHCSSNGGSELVYLNNSDPGLPEVDTQSCAGWDESVNGQRHASEPMEVDRVSLPGLRDSKRLKRGVLLPALPTLSAEHSFVSGILDRCSNSEQRHFALAYKRWLDTVIDQQPWEKKREQIAPSLLNIEVAFRQRFRISLPTVVLKVINSASNKVMTSETSHWVAQVLSYPLDSE